MAGDWLAANRALRAARDAMNEHKRLVHKFRLTDEQAREVVSDAAVFRDIMADDPAPALEPPGL